jgi:hypothetical protein
MEQEFHGLKSHYNQLNQICFDVCNFIGASAAGAISCELYRCYKEEE